MNFRIGFGYDVHALSKGYKLWLGGVMITESFGAVGHSDADVLTHAICDALLGAANLGDIGQHFPDTSDEFKNISSIILLKSVIKLLANKDYTVENIDSTIVLQQPKIANHIAQMKLILSNAMNCDQDAVSIKATTSEHLGFVGKKEGIAAYAVVLIRK